MREAALVVFMKPFGAAAGPVVATGLLWDAELFSSGIVGWLATLAWPASAPARSDVHAT